MTQKKQQSLNLLLFKSYFQHFLSYIKHKYRMKMCYRYSIFGNLGQKNEKFFQGKKKVFKPQNVMLFLAFSLSIWEMILIFPYFPLHDIEGFFEASWLKISSIWKWVSKDSMET